MTTLHAPAEQYQVRLQLGEPGETGWWAEVLGLPGCVTQGDTLAELEQNLAEVIPLWLAAGGQPRPADPNPPPWAAAPPCIYYLRQKLLLAPKS